MSELSSSKIDNQSNVLAFPSMSTTEVQLPASKNFPIDTKAHDEKKLTPKYETPMIYKKPAAEIMQILQQQVEQIKKKSHELGYYLNQLDKNS